MSQNAYRSDTLLISTDNLFIVLTSFPQNISKEKSPCGRGAALDPSAMARNLQGVSFTLTQ